MKNVFRSSLLKRTATGSSAILSSATAAVALSLLAPVAQADDVSAPAMLQWFETSWNTMENRSADVFSAGYGGIWVPPPGMANSGTGSVGYDVYDRFDLGSDYNHKTRYGTLKDFQAVTAAMHKAGVSVYSDLVWNHNGTADSSTVDNGSNVTFPQSGGYPGFAITLQNTDPTKPGYNTQGINDVDGDFHGAFAGGDQDGRLAGLIDIDHSKNYQFIRNPVNPTDSRNLPAGTTGIYGRPAANVAKASNAQYYPDRDAGGKTYYDPRTNQSYTTYDFNTAAPMTGDAVPENATGYLMRQARWMVQVAGVDGFRLDAVKNMPSWVLNYYDVAVQGANTRTLLDGSQKRVFGFSEAFDSNFGTLQSYIRKDAASSTQISGNRDVLDFPLFFAMNGNLSNNGFNNDWRNIKNASIDKNDDGLANNGSQGVTFVSSADNSGAYLNNVAYAYTMMRPGNALVYDNSHSISGQTFPQDGRGDALGGVYGDTITKLVDIRNTHGRGNYIDRTPAANEKEILVYERSNSALVVLSNRLDAGKDNITVATNFKPGTPLLELTGNAANSTINSDGSLAQVVVVNADGTANITVPRNVNSNGVETGKGYLIYGPSGPQGSLTLNNVASTLAGVTPTAANNSTGRLANISVITAANFDVTLNTKKVNLLNTIRDADADGDNALISIDNKIDVNGNGTVDFRSPGDTKYGFDAFTTVRTVGYGNTDTNNVGTYTQTVNTSALSEGYHNIDVRAYRHRDVNEPEIFTDFKQTIYVDRFKPVSAVDAFDQQTYSNDSKNRTLTIKSVDETATSVNVFLDQPASVSDATLLSYVGDSSNTTSQLDRDIFKKDYGNIGSGTHVVTVVTKEITGNTNIQRLVIGNVTTGRGAGLGDLNYDGAYSAGDVTGTSYGMEALIYPTNANAPVNLTTNFSNTVYNGAADVNGDGLIDSRDLYSQRDRFIAIGAPAATIAAAKAAVLRRADLNGDGVTNQTDIDVLYRTLGNTAWKYDLNSSAWQSIASGPRTDVGSDRADVDTLVLTIFGTRYGDADLNGKIDANDYSRIDSSFTTQFTNPQYPYGWLQGDFTGDGKIDANDYSLIDGSFVAQQNGNNPNLLRAIANNLLGGGSLAGLGLDAGTMNEIEGHFDEFGNPYAYGLLAAAPEPSGVAVVMFGAASLTFKRRRGRYSNAGIH